MEIKSITNLQAFPEAMENSESTLDLAGAYEKVATIQRAVELRAYGLSNLPFGLFAKDGDTEIAGPTYDAVSDFVKPLLYQVGASLAIYGAAYLGYYRGVWREQPMLLLRPMLTPSIAPQYDGAGNLTHFLRYANNTVMQLQLKDLLWIWRYNPRYENYPGISPLQTVLRSAGTLHNLNVFAEHFFKNGALMPTIFTIGDGNSSMPSVITDKEMLSFRDRLKRLLVGVKNAWRVDVMRGNVESHTIGALPRDVAANELTTLTNQEICTAFGIPGAVFRSDTANYANAREDEYHFYNKTVVPEAVIHIQPRLNEWLGQMGYRLEFQPNLLESYQYTQMQQALTLSQLSDILSVNERREMLGYEPIEGGDEIIRNSFDPMGNGNGFGDAEQGGDTGLNVEEEDEDIKRWRASYAKLWEDYVGGGV